MSTYDQCLARIIEEADIDEKLIEHVLNCDERFCQEFRKLLNYASSFHREPPPRPGDYRLCGSHGHIMKGKCGNCGAVLERDP